MEDIYSKLGAFVASKDSRLACAAAVILSELSPRNSAVVHALTAGLEQPDPVRRPYIIEALGHIGTTEAAAALVPLIKAEGPHSEQALRALANNASAALKPLLQMLGTVPPALLERIAECTARTAHPSALATLLGHLSNADVEVCKSIRAGLRAAMSSFDAKAKEQLRRHLEKAFQDRDLCAQPSSLIALIKISGDLGDQALLKHVLERTEKGNPPNVRRAALQALALMHLSPEQRSKLAQRLLVLVQDSDMANIAEPALESLRNAQLGSEHQGALRKLLNSPSSRIREFGMQALAQQGSARTLHELIACLDSPDRAVREEALGALSRAPSAAPALAERLLEQAGGEAVQATARALAPQAAQLPKRLLAKLADEYVRLSSSPERKKMDFAASQRAEEKGRAILGIFRAAHAAELVQAAFQQALKLRQKDDALKAHELLKHVAGMTGWQDEHRIELALAGLMLGPKDLTRSTRNTDVHLQSLQDILYTGRRSAKELAKELLKDSALSRRLLYYLGFHFVERVNNEREFGRLLLEHLAENRSEEGRQAKEKLVIEGLATLKGGKANILEERARVLLSASDMLPVSAERKAPRQSHNGPAPTPSRSKSQVKPAKGAKRKSGAKR